VDGWFVARPAEPEKPTGEGETTEHDRGKTPFRDGDAVVGGEFAIVGGLG